MLNKFSGMSLDVLISDLAKIDPNVQEVTTNIKLFMDKGDVSKVAIQVAWNAESRFFILDENMNLVYEDSYNKYSRMHPELSEVVDKFIGQRLASIKKNALASKRVVIKPVTSEPYGIKGILNSIKQMTA